jgi:hypothetical protein
LMHYNTSTVCMVLLLSCDWVTASLKKDEFILQDFVILFVAPMDLVLALNSD